MTIYTPSKRLFRWGPFILLGTVLLFGGIFVFLRNYSGEMHGANYWLIINLQLILRFSFPIFIVTFVGSFLCKKIDIDESSGNVTITNFLRRKKLFIGTNFSAYRNDYDQQKKITRITLIMKDHQEVGIYAQPISSREVKSFLHLLEQSTHIKELVSPQKSPEEIIELDKKNARLPVILLLSLLAVIIVGILVSFVIVGKMFENIPK